MVGSASLHPPYAAKPEPPAIEPPSPAPEPKPAAVTPEPVKSDLAKPDVPASPSAANTLPAEAIAGMNAVDCRTKAVTAIMRAWNMAVVGGLPRDDSIESIAAFAAG